MKMFATFDSHVHLDSYKIHTPYFAVLFSDFLSTCDLRYMRQEVVESKRAEHAPFGIPPGKVMIGTRY